MALADFARNKLLRYVFGSDSFASPSDYYYGLTNGLLQHDGSNMVNVEITGGGYERKIYSNLPAYWGQTESGVVGNLGAIAWTATSNWGLVTHFFIIDHAIEGNGSGLIFVGPLSQERLINSGDYLYFGTSGIAVGLY